MAQSEPEYTAGREQPDQQAQYPLYADADPASRTPTTGAFAPMEQPVYAPPPAPASPAAYAPPGPPAWGGYKYPA